MVYVCDKVVYIFYYLEYLYNHIEHYSENILIHTL